MADFGTVAILCPPNVLGAIDGWEAESPCWTTVPMSLWGKLWVLVLG